MEAALGKGNLDHAEAAAVEAAHRRRRTRSGIGVSGQSTGRREYKGGGRPSFCTHTASGTYTAPSTSCTAPSTYTAPGTYSAAPASPRLPAPTTRLPAPTRLSAPIRLPAPTRLLAPTRLRHLHGSRHIHGSRHLSHGVTDTLLFPGPGSESRLSSSSLTHAELLQWDNSGVPRFQV